MKKFTFLLCALALAFTLGAEDGVRMVKRLTVNLTSGVAEHYNLEDQPEVTFPESRMEVTTLNAAVAYERSEVENFTITEAELNALDQVEADYSFTYRDGVVSIAAPSLTAAKVVAVNGSVVASAKADAGSVIEISLADLPAGVYLVVPEGHRSVKIIK